MKCWSYSCSIWNRFGWKEILQKSPDISNKSNMLNASHPVLVDSFFFPLFAGFYRFQVVHGFQPWSFDFKAKTEDPSEATLDTQPGSNENRWICCFKKCFKYFLKLISWLHPESFYLLLYFAGSYFQIISLSLYRYISIHIVYKCKLCFFKYTNICIISNIHHGFLRKMRLKVPSSEFGTKELVDLQGWYKRTRRKIRRMIGSNRSTGGIGEKWWWFSWIGNGISTIHT